MGNAAPILTHRRRTSSSSSSGVTDDTIADADLSVATCCSANTTAAATTARKSDAAAPYAFWSAMAGTASQVGDPVMLQKALMQQQQNAKNNTFELEMLCTTAAAHGHAACLRALVEFAASEGVLLHLRAADVAASLHGRTECSMYLRDLLWPTSAVAQHQQRLCALLDVEFHDLESGAYHLARSFVACVCT